MTVKIIVGDALETLRTMPDESVQCCVTSPPYFGLRSYLPDGVKIKESLPPEKLEWLLAELSAAGVFPND